MGSKNESLAEELMRSYNYVRRFVGVLWADDRGGVVLSQPEFPPDRLGDLAALLLRDDAPTTPELAQAVGAREVFEITPGHLGKGWFHLGALERSDVQRLIDKGVRPLRSLRHRDVAALMAACRAALERAQQPVSRPVDLTERLGRLFGEDGLRAAERFAAAMEAERLASSEERLAEFSKTAARVVRNEGPSRPDLRKLWTQMAKLPAEPAARARGLVGLLRDFAGGETPHALGRRRTLEGAVRGLPLDEAAARLVELADAPSEETPQSGWTDARRAELLRLALRSRHTSLPLPRDPAMLEPFAFIIAGRSDGELEVVWRRLARLNPAKVAQHRWTLRDSSLPIDLLSDALELDVLGSIWAFEDAPALALYLDAVRQLQARPIPGIRPTDDWFVRPFAGGFSWEPALMLGLIANHRKDPESLVSALAAVRASELADFGFAEAFTSWDSPVVEPRPEHFDAVGEALDLTVTQLERYVHWRRLVGYETDFSDTVLKPVHAAQGEDRELQHLLTMEQSTSIAKRVEALQNPERRAARVESAARRARNAFDRAMEVLRRESLEAVMNGVTRSTFERLLGRTLSGDLPPRLRSLMLLISAENVEFSAVRELLEDVLAGRDLAARPANIKWLSAMSNRGVDTQRWLQGLDLVVEVGGEKLRVYTETDPLHVLEMGSYFNTCLSLEDGFNAASTLTNAIDVNKQVLYGRRDDGTVVARKLIGATDDGTLLGYVTYAFDHKTRLDAQLSAAVAAFAEECGLRLGTVGQPTALHDTFWYDDGVVPWRVQPDIGLPEHLPGDVTAEAEYAYWRGFEDPQWWRWATTLDEHSWGPICAARAFDGTQAGDLPHDARVFLAARGRFDWLHSGDVHPYDDLREIGDVIPPHRDAALAFARAVRGSGGAKPRHWAELAQVPRGLAVLEPGEVAHYVIDHVRLARELEVECFVDQHFDCIATFVRLTADVLHASWIRHRGGDIDRLFASRDPLIQRVAVGVAQRVISPPLGRRVRALLKERGTEPEIVWALARQGDSASLWALQSALETEPTNLEIVAAIEMFAPDHAPAARAVMRVPERFPGASLIRDLRLENTWPNVPGDELAFAGLAVTDEGRRDAYEHACALRSAGTQTNAVWAEHVREKPGSHLFAPSRAESIRLRDGIYSLDPDAIAYALRRYGHAQLGLVGLALDDEALAPIWAHIDTTSSHDALILMRPLFLRVPSTRALMAVGEVLDEWNASKVFADDVEIWRRYLHELAACGQTRKAMVFGDLLARHVEPDDFRDVMHDVWRTHEAAFVEDVCGIVESQMAEWPADCRSFHLMELFIRWVAPRTDADPTPFVKDKLRSDWTVARWNDARTQ